VDWRDSPKEDKQKFTKMCEVRMKKKINELFNKVFFLIRFYLQHSKKKQKQVEMNVFFLLLL